MTTFRGTTTTYQPGARTLPREYYTSEAILVEERDRIFAHDGIASAARPVSPSRGSTSSGRSPANRSSWCAIARGRSARSSTSVVIAAPGSAGKSRGGFGETIQCPYHAWTYKTDGRLIGAPHMQEVEGFDMAEYPLHAAAIAEWEGFLFVNVAEKPEPFENAWAPMIGPLRPLRPAEAGGRAPRRLRRAGELEAGIPELLRVPPLPDDPPQARDGAAVSERRRTTSPRAPFLGGYMEIKAPNESATMSGRACGRAGER